MPLAPRVPSLASIARISDSAAHFSLGCRDFLDGFYEAPSDEKLSEEPPVLREVLQDDGYVDAYLAAMAEYLARRYQLAVPRWSQDPKRVAAKPVFAMKTHEGRMFLLVESPSEFRARNIFISADALTRV